MSASTVGAIEANRSRREVGAGLGFRCQSPSLVSGEAAAYLASSVGRPQHSGFAGWREEEPGKHAAGAERSSHVRVDHSVCGRRWRLETADAGYDEAGRRVKGDRTKPPASPAGCGLMLFGNSVYVFDWLSFGGTSEPNRSRRRFRPPRPIPTRGGRHAPSVSVPLCFAGEEGLGSRSGMTSRAFFA